MKTSIVRRGDIFFIRDNIKSTNSGHFYVVYQTSNGYRRPNICLRCTSSDYHVKDLISIILSTNGDREPILTKIVPYTFAYFKDSDFIPMNFRGFIPEDSECFNLIEAIVNNTLNRKNGYDMHQSDFSPIDEWLNSWNNRVKHEFESISIKFSNSKKPLNINQVSFSNTASDVTVSKCNNNTAINPIYAKIDEANKILNDIPRILKYKMMSEIRKVFNTFNDSLRDYSKYDSETDLLLKKIDEYHAAGTIVKYCELTGKSRPTAFRNYKKWMIDVISKLKPIDYPTIIDGNKDQIQTIILTNVVNDNK